MWLYFELCYIMFFLYWNVMIVYVPILIIWHASLSRYKLESHTALKDVTEWSDLPRSYRENERKADITPRGAEVNALCWVISWHAYVL